MKQNVQELKNKMELDIPKMIEIKEKKIEELSKILNENDKKLKSLKSENNKVCLF